MTAMLLPDRGEFVLQIGVGAARPRPRCGGNDLPDPALPFDDVFMTVIQPTSGGETRMVNDILHGQPHALGDARPAQTAAPEQHPARVDVSLLILRRRPIVATLSILVVVLFLLSMAGQVARFHFDRPTVLGLVDMFYLDLENNLPTWYQSVNFLFAAGLMTIIGLSDRNSGKPFAAHWLGLATLFSLLSLDEVASLHESTIQPMQRLIVPTGVWAPTWVILGIALVGILILVYWRFFFHFGRRQRLHMALAGIIFLGGALAAEMMSGALFDTTDPDFKNSFSYAVLANIEELLEMAGLLIFIDFLLRRAGRSAPLRITVSGK